MSKLKQTIEPEVSFWQKLYNLCTSCCGEDKTQIAENQIEVSIEYSSLDFSGKRLGNKVIEELEELLTSSTTNLNLSSNGLDDEGAIKLSKMLKNSKIEELNISGNFMTDLGAKAIFANLPKCIKSLNVGDNKFGDDGLITLVEKLSDIKLKFLDISCNSITKIGLKALAVKLPDTELIFLDLRASVVSQTVVELIEKSLPPTIKYANTLCYNEALELIGQELNYD